VTWLPDACLSYAKRKDVRPAGCQRRVRLAAHQPAADSPAIARATSRPTLPCSTSRCRAWMGWSLLAQLRRQHPVPVIFLTSKDDGVDELLGLREDHSRLWIAALVQFSRDSTILHLRFTPNPRLSEVRLTPSVYAEIGNRGSPSGHGILPPKIMAALS
jgi:hypothetical protein